MCSFTSLEHCKNFNPLFFYFFLLVKAHQGEHFLSKELITKPPYMLSLLL